MKMADQTPKHVVGKLILMKAELQLNTWLGREYTPLHLLHIKLHLPSK
jgi:hypothetical protein